MFGEHQPGVTDVWDEYQRAARPSRATTPRRSRRGARTRSGSAPRSPQATSTGLRGAVGTPDQIREYLRRYEEAGVDQVIFVLQAGKNRHEHIMETLELFGTRGAARVQERDEKRHRSEGEAARPVIEAAMARKVETDVAMPDDYVMKALPKQLIKAVGGDELLETTPRRSRPGCTGCPAGRR